MTSIFLRPILSPKWPKTMPPSGPGEEADGVGAEGEQGRGGGLAAGEEQRAEDQGGGRSVEEEVVPFHGGADQAGERRP